jgi:hypothetical protein
MKCFIPAAAQPAAGTKGVAGGAGEEIGRTIVFSRTPAHWCLMHFYNEQLKKQRVD